MTYSNPSRSQRTDTSALLVPLVCFLMLTGCSQGDSQHPVIPDSKVERSTQEFGIFWPPRDLGRPEKELDEPLLNGELSVFTSELPKPDTFRIQIALRRPESETDRIRWNKNLAFPEHAWMAKVRVWDRDERWLWPNLPYLLRAHGEERVERYGGVDPGKGVDNDFAAVLIRPLTAQPSRSSVVQPEASSQPLVSAEWHGDGAENVDGKSVVHTARSEEFRIRLSPGSIDSDFGRLGVWLIYADFLGARLPKSWPQKPEYAGGILAFFELKWQRTPDGQLQFNIEHLVPTTDTGFDWADWSTGPSRLQSNLEMLIPQ